MPPPGLPRLVGADAAAALETLVPVDVVDLGAGDGGQRKGGDHGPVDPLVQHADEARRVAAGRAVRAARPGPAHPGAAIGRGEMIEAGSEAGIAFGQQIVFAHDGGPFVSYESRTWLLDGDEITGPGPRESGFWRPQADGTLEVLIVHSTGLVTPFYGNARKIGGKDAYTVNAIRMVVNELNGIDNKPPQYR